jgi:hypothetical protein
VEILQSGERKAGPLQDKQGFREFIFFTYTLAEILLTDDSFKFQNDTCLYIVVWSLYVLSPALSTIFVS